MSVTVRALAPAKVNLCLFLGGTRADGRHQLVTLFQSLSLADELELVTLGGSASDRVVCPGVGKDNLVNRAIVALREGGWAGPPVLIRILKRIPIAAGMGGGSADAAAALRLAVAIAPWPAGELDALAATLGADVPSQLIPGLALGTGAGDLIERREPLEPHAYVIVPSHQRLSTADVYREADRLGLARSAVQMRERHRQLVAALAAGGGRLPAELIVNDLQVAALSLCPSIADVLSAVTTAGAQQAIVSGSGPTVAGVFWGRDSRSRARTAARELAAHPGVAVATPVVPPFGAAELVAT